MTEREEAAPVVRRWGIAYAFVVLLNLAVVVGAWLAFRPYR